jgi:hypothetical protein
MKGRLLATLGLAVIIAATGAYASIPALAPPVIQPVDFIRKLAFVHGERMVFRFGWNDIPAAEMSIVTRRELLKGRPVFHYQGAAETLSHVRWLYPLSDRVEATLDAQSLDPVHYALYQDENGVQTATTVVRSAGDNKLTGFRVGSAQKESTVQVERDGDYDPVTIAYLARSVPCEVGQAYSYKVFDGRYQYVLTLTVERRETIRIKAGTYKALRIRPSIVNLSKPDGPRKVKQATLWVSDDDRRVPLRVESEVFFGKVYGELVAYSAK